MKFYYAYPKKVVERAHELRRNGYTYREINEKLLTEFTLSRKVPKGTFSSWFTKANIRLTKRQEKRITKIRKSNILLFQKMGARAIHNKKMKSFDHASLDAKFTLKELIKHPHHALLFLSGLYLGEGAKISRDTFFIGNSDPLLLKTVLKILHATFHINSKKIGVSLYLRADQNEENELCFWSDYLKIPKNQFTKSQRDMRTIGKTTWPGYHGVCAISYYDVTIHRFLVALQNEYMRCIAIKGGW